MSGNALRSSAKPSDKRLVSFLVAQLSQMPTTSMCFGTPASLTDNRTNIHATNNSPSQDRPQIILPFRRPPTNLLRCCAFFHCRVPYLKTTATHPSNYNQRSWRESVQEVRPFLNQLQFELRHVGKRSAEFS